MHHGSPSSKYSNSGYSAIQECVEGPEHPDAYFTEFQLHADIISAINRSGLWDDHPKLIKDFFIHIENAFSEFIKLLLQEIIDGDDRAKKIVSLYGVLNMAQADWTVTQKILTKYSEFVPKLCDMIQKEAERDFEGEQFKIFKTSVLVLKELNPLILVRAESIKNRWVAREFLIAIANYFEEGPVYKVTNEDRCRGIENAILQLVTHRENINDIVQSAIQVFTQAIGNSINQADLEVTYFFINYSKHGFNPFDFIIHIFKENENEKVISELCKLISFLSSVPDVRQLIMKKDILGSFHSRLEKFPMTKEGYRDFVFFVLDIGGPTKLMSVIPELRMMDFSTRFYQGFNHILGYIKHQTQRLEVSVLQYEDDYLRLLINKLTPEIIKNVSPEENVSTSVNENPMDLTNIMVSLTKAIIQRIISVPERPDFNTLELEALQTAVKMAINVMKCQPYNGQAIQDCVEIIGRVAGEKYNKILNNNDLDQILVHMEVVQANHRNDATIQHWIFWILLVTKGLIFLKPFIANSTSSQQVTEASINAINEYYHEDNRLDDEVTQEEQRTCVEVCQILIQAMALHFYNKELGVLALGLLMIQCNQPDEQVCTFIISCLEFSSLNLKTNAIKALRTVLGKFPVVRKAINDKTITLIQEHLDNNFPVLGGNEDLFRNALYILADARDPEVVYQFIEREICYIRPGLWRLALESFVTTWNIREREQREILLEQVRSNCPSSVTADMIQKEVNVEAHRRVIQWVGRINDILNYAKRTFVGKEDVEAQINLVEGFLINPEHVYNSMSPSMINR